MFNKVLIVGAGQTGTAITHDIMTAHPNTTIYITDINPELKEAYYARLRELGTPNLENVHFTSLSEGSLNEGMRGPDLAILCVPGSQQANAIKSIAPYVYSSTILTDVCSAKEHAITRIRGAIEEHIHNVLGFCIEYVPFHILNGFAGDGPTSAKAGILHAAGVIVPGFASASAESAVSNFLKSLGTTIHKMDAVQHDTVLSTTSQFRYVEAFATSLCAFYQYMGRGQIDAGGLNAARLRIVAASPEMWAGNFTDCRDRILETNKGADLFYNTLLQQLKNGDLSEIDKRINIASEYAAQMPSANVQQYNLQQFNPAHLALNAISAVISLPFVENVMRVERETGVKIPTLCNPSAKDGMAVIGMHPEQSKFLIQFHRNTLHGMLKEFMKNKAHVIGLIDALKPNPEMRGGIIVDPSFEAVRKLVRDCGLIKQKNIDPALARSAMARASSKPTGFEVR